MEVSGDPLAFFLLQPDTGVEEQLLLVLFDPLQLQLIANDLPLVKDNKNDQPDGKRQHADSAKKEHQRYTASGVSNF